MKYIYALIDPRDRSVRYVGQTNSLNRRYIEHCNTNKSTTKDLWLQELRNQGLKPDMALLEAVKRDKDAGFREKWWIRLAERSGWILDNTGNPSAHEPNFEKLFSDRLRDEYDSFLFAMRSAEPVVMITRAQFKVFLTLLYIATSVIVGFVIGAGAWHFDYSVKGNMFSAIWLGATMGIVSAYMLWRVAALGFKRSWFAYVYCGVYFLFGLHQLWS